MYLCTHIHKLQLAYMLQSLSLSLFIIYLFFGCSAQRLHALGDESKLLPLWRQVSPHFDFDLFFFSLYICCQYRLAQKLYHCFLVS